MNSSQVSSFIYVIEKSKNNDISRSQTLHFISDTKSQRLLVTRHRLSCEKVNLHNTLIT